MIEIFKVSWLEDLSLYVLYIVALTVERGDLETVKKEIENLLCNYCQFTAITFADFMTRTLMRLWEMESKGGGRKMRGWHR